MSKLSLKNQRLIICCGDTEENYFKALKSSHRIRGLKILNRGRNAPITVVNKVVKNRTYQDYKSIFIICDKDSFDFNELVSILKQEGINNVKVVISNPCFELWFVLHHKLVNYEISVQDCQKLWKNIYKKKYDKEYKKADKGVFKNIEKLTSKAIANAKKIDAKTDTDMIVSCRINPLTLVYELFEELKLTH